MLEVALIGLEKTINAYIKLDPDCIKKIATLQGKSLKITLSDWSFSFYVIATNCGLQLSLHQHNANTTIEATLAQFIKFYIKGASNTEMLKNKITISGDTMVAANFREVFQSIDIDWEEHLSTLLGDTVAHHTGNATRNFFKTSKSILGSIKQNIQEYLFFESELLPTEKQLKKFSTNVNTLRNDVERLEARFNRIKNKRETT